MQFLINQHKRVKLIIRIPFKDCYIRVLKYIYVFKNFFQLITSAIKSKLKLLHHDIKVMCPVVQIESY